MFNASGTNVYTADGRVVHIATAVASARGASAPAGPPGYEGPDALHKPSLQGPGPVTDADPEGHTAHQTPSTTLTTMPQLPADLAQAAMARASQAAVNAVTARAAEDSARAAWQAAQLQSHATPVGERFAYHPVAVASDIQLLPASASPTPAGQPHTQESHAATARGGAQGGGRDGSDGTLLPQPQAAGATDVAGGPDLDLGSYRAVTGAVGISGGSAHSPGHRGASREVVRLLGGGVAPHPAELVSHVRMLGQRE